MLKRILALLLVVAFVLPLTPASAQDLAGEITFVTFMSEWVTAFRTAADDYMALHPSVSITVSTVPYDGLQDFYRTNLVGGTAPEIMHAEPWWNNLATLDLIIPFDNYFAEPNPYNAGDTPWGDTFVQPFLDFARDATGKINVAPWSLYGVGMFYDKTFFDAHGIAAPATWNEFLDACRAIKDAGALPMYIALKPNDAQWFWPTGMIGNFAMRSKVEAVNLLHADGWTFDIDDPTSTIGESITVDEAWVAFKKGLIDPAVAPEYRIYAEMAKEWADACTDPQAALAADGAEVYQAFWTGQSKIFMNGTWFISTLVNELANLPEEQQFEWSIFAHPTPTTENGDVFSMGAINQNMNLRNGFIVPKGLDPAKEAIAIDFLRFMTSTEEATKLFSLNRVDEDTGAEYPWSYDPPAIVGVPMRPGTEALYPRIDYGEMGLFLASAPGDTQSWTEWLTFFGQEYLGGMIDIDTVLEEWSFSLEAGLERSLETYKDEVDQVFIDANLP